MNSGKQTVTSFRPLNVVEASAEGTDRHHNVAVPPNNPGVPGGATAKDGGGAGVERGGVGAEAETVGGLIIP